MKKIIFTLLLICLTTATIAQRGPRREQAGKRLFLSSLTAEQQATLRVKKMALSLDLNEGQKSELLKLFTEQATAMKQKREVLRKQREEGQRLDPEKRFELANERLDNAYKIQQAMKNVLNEEQYLQWREHQKNKRRRHRTKRR